MKNYFRMIVLSVSLIHILMLINVRVAAINLEVCNNEMIEMECGSDQLIMTESAEYGRMKENSRCIGKTFGYIGCSTDVNDVVSIECTGKMSCTKDLSIFNNVNSTCPKDLKSYLYVEFDCIEILPFNTVINKNITKNGVYTTKLPSTNYTFKSPIQRLLTISVMVLYNEEANQVVGEIVAKDRNENKLSISRGFANYYHNKWQEILKTNNLTHSVTINRLNSNDMTVLLQLSTEGCGIIDNDEIKVIEANYNSAKVFCGNSDDIINLKCDNGTWTNTNIDCSYLDQNLIGNQNEKDDMSGDKSIILTSVFTILCFLALIVIVVFFIYRFKKNNNRETTSNVSTDV